MSDYSKLYDVIIIGGGPAGLSAAIYASRENLRVLVIEKDDFGGQIALTAKVENYPGISPCSGRELADQMKEQAKGFGADLIYGKVGEMNLEATIKEV
ncbi:MAG: FAD-dependent oxidoreductase, partial [Eubacterium sp.]|nr:FAD-dependent oxidoreductase [Eubacterium sp.]